MIHTHPGLYYVGRSNYSRILSPLAASYRSSRSNTFWELAVMARLYPFACWWLRPIRCSVPSLSDPWGCGFSRGKVWSLEESAWPSLLQECLGLWSQASGWIGPKPTSKWLFLLDWIGDRFEMTCSLGTWLSSWGLSGQGGSSDVSSLGMRRWFHCQIPMACSWTPWG